MFIGYRKEKSSHNYPKNNKIFKRNRTRTYVIFNCDICGLQFEKLKGACHKKDNNEVKHFCSKCSSPSIIGAIGKKKLSKIWEQRIGEKQIDACGYPTIYVGNSHPYSDGYCGRVREHILVMENHLQRALVKGEVVHHIDGDKTNNDISNLDLCSVQEHNACHAASEKIIFDLYKSGLVGYDREIKRYYLNKEIK